MNEYNIIEEFRKVYKEFEKYEGKKWVPEVIMTELSKQVGELAKYVMLKEGAYFLGRENEEKYKFTMEDIGDEMVDVIDQVTRLADYYEIDLVEASKRARKNDWEFFKKLKGKNE